MLGNLHLRFSKIHAPHLPFPENLACRRMR